MIIFLPINLNMCFLVLKRTVSLSTMRLSYVVGTQKNHLNETVVLSTHNIRLDEN